jgi:hypothetical protein
VRDGDDYLMYKGCAQIDSEGKDVERGRRLR